MEHATSGLNILRYVKNNKELNNILFLLITSNYEPDLIWNSIRDGADDYIMKDEKDDVIISRINHHLELKNLKNDFEDSITAAERVQKPLMSDESLLKDDRFEHFLFYEPKMKVGGDFYYWKKIKNELLLIIGDCTGHGVPAALYSILSMKTIEQTCALVPPEPVMILNTLNYSLSKYYDTINKADGGMEIAVCKIDFDNKKFHIDSLSRIIIHVY
jgi:serine phosphatase RsbU (regulator of sigma subunit)